MAVYYLLTCGFDCFEVYKCDTVEVDKPLTFCCMAVGKPLTCGCGEVTIKAVEKSLTFMDVFQ